MSTKKSSAKTTAKKPAAKVAAKKPTAKTTAKKPIAKASAKGKKDKAQKPAEKAQPKKKAAADKKVADKKVTDKKVADKKAVAADKKVTAADKKAAAADKKKLADKKATSPAKKKGKSKKVAEAEQIEQETLKNLDFAFSFAEEMKKAQRNADAEKEKRAISVKLSRRPDTRVKGKNTQKFPASDLAQFKKSLLLLRQTMLGQSVSLRDVALEQTEERGGEDEDGSDAFLRLQNLSQADSRNRIVQKIDEALARIADGTYGVCEHCGRLIRKPRLLNQPFVHTCMECQILLEQR